MNLKNLTIIVGFTFIVFACKTGQETEAIETIVHSDVSVTHPVEKDTSVFAEYQGITQFTQHVQIRAQSAGIISKSLVSMGSTIDRNHALFVVKSREASILNSSLYQNNLVSKIADTVFSFSSGIIDQVMVQQGDFVQQGDLLASCVIENSMRVLVSVPLEENIEDIQNKSCTILLPDGRNLQGTIGSSLPLANIGDQASRFLVNPVSGKGLSENIHVRVRIKKQDITKGMFVPKTSVYANEELTNYWVFVVTQDTLAIKLPVRKGVEIDSMIEITNSTLQLTDQIIFKGGYGLPDSSLVKITD